MSTPRQDLPHYDADEEHDGKQPTDRQWVVHPEPEQPDPDPQSGSGQIDFADGRPADAEGGDAPSHDSA